MLQTMINLKLLFSVCIILACQQLFSITLTTGGDIYVSEESERQSHFADNNNTLTLYGEVQAGLKLKLPYPKEPMSFSLRLKSDDFRKIENQFVTKSKLIETATFDFKTPCFSIIFVPLYIQTGNFIL